MFRKALILLSILFLLAITPAYGYYLEYSGSKPGGTIFGVINVWDELQLRWDPEEGFRDFKWGNTRPYLPVLRVQADPGDDLDALVTVRVTQKVVTDLQVTNSNFSDLDYGYDPPDFPMSVTELVTFKVGEWRGEGYYPYYHYHDIWWNSRPTVIDETMEAFASIYVDYSVYAEFELVPDDIPVPEPGVFWLFGTGLMGIGMIRSRLKAANKN